MNYRKPILFPIVGFGLFLIIQMLVPSQFNGFLSPITEGFSVLVENDYAADLFIGREKNVSFYHRICFRSIHKGFIQMGFPIQISFSLISCFFIILNYLLIVLLSRRLLPNENKDRYLWLSLFYFGSFSLLFGYLGGMFTYEEPIQYTFLLGSLLFLFRNKMLLSSLFLLGALLSKETSLLYVPVLLILLPQNTPHYRHKLKLLSVLLFLVVLSYAVYHIYWVPAGMGQDLVKFTTDNRFFAWRSNFAALDISLVSILNAFLVLGIPLLLVIRSYPISTDPALKRQMKIFILFAIVNCGLVWVAALAREARLFMLPILLFLPLIPICIDHLKKQKMKALNILINVTISVIMSVFVYRPAMVGTGYIYKAYLFLYTFLFLWVLLQTKSSSQKMALK